VGRGELEQIARAWFGPMWERNEEALWKSLPPDVELRDVIANNGASLGRLAPRHAGNPRRFGATLCAADRFIGLCTAPATIVCSSKNATTETYSDNFRRQRLAKIVRSDSKGIVGGLE
jgi:hypothetical protein